MSTPPQGQWPTPPEGSHRASATGHARRGDLESSVSRAARRGKWLLGGLALLVTVVVTVVATLLFTRNGAHTPSPAIATSPSNPTADVENVASADDRGAVGLILEDPTCAAWEPIARTLSERQQNGWNVRDPSIPRSSWTAKQREQFDEIGKAMLSAADQTMRLSKVTPHRVMRELYEQSVAYWRAYANKLTDYKPEDDSLALVASSTSGALVWICASIQYGSAAARMPLVSQGTPPLSIADIAGPGGPERFMETRSPVCTEWTEIMDRFNLATDRWAAALDPNVPSSQWSPTVRDLSASMAMIFQENAGQVQNLGATSQNATINDFASLAAQYQRAYVQAIPSYTPADNYLNSTAAELVVAVSQACLAAGT